MKRPMGIKVLAIFFFILGAADLLSVGYYALTGAATFWFLAGGASRAFVELFCAIGLWRFQNASRWLSIFWLFLLFATSADNYYRSSLEILSEATADYGILLAAFIAGGILFLLGFCGFPVWYLTRPNITHLFKSGPPPRTEKEIK